jgi:hypothetical protein
MPCSHPSPATEWEKRPNATWIPATGTRSRWNAVSFRGTLSGLGADTAAA